jgi:hypothetical protein
MAKLIDEFRRGWQGTSQPSPLFGIGFAASCIGLATAARWCLALIRPDVFFTPYFPAVFFATAFGGFRVGIATAVVGGALGVTLNFSDAPADFARLALLVIYLVVCGRWKSALQSACRNPTLIALGRIALMSNVPCALSSASVQPWCSGEKVPLGCPMQKSH